DDQPLLGDLPVQVNRQLGDAAHGPADAQEAQAYAGTVATDRHAARKPQVAVEPAVQEHGPVGLDAELARPGPPQVGPRLATQVGAVGVRAHDPEAAVGLVLGRDRPRDEAAAPDHEP